MELNRLRGSGDTGTGQDAAGMEVRSHRRPTSYNTMENSGDYNDQKEKEELTIDEVLDHIGFGFPQLKIVFLTSIIWVADGMEVMVLSILGPLLETDWHIRPVQQAMLTTCVMAGMGIGAWFFGYMLDSYGRRKTLILSALWTVFYAGLTALVPNFVWMVIMRFLVGIGISGGIMGVSYFSEFLPTKNRGIFSVFALFFWAIGGMANVLAAMAFMRFGWRIWLLSTAIPGIIFLLGSPALPKSPRYALACGNKEEAWRILEGIAAQNGQTLPDAKLKELQLRPRAQFTDLFVPKLKSTSILLAAVWSLSGFIYYGIVLFSTGLIETGDSCSKVINPTIDPSCFLGSKGLDMNDFIILLWTSSAELPGLLLAIVLVETVGRRRGMAINYMICGAVLMILMFCLPKVPMVIILFAARGTSSSAMQIIFPYTNEMYPTEVRGLAFGMGSAFARIGALITPYFAQVLFSWSLSVGVGVYAFVILIQVLVCCLLPVETMGKPMADNYAE